MFSGHLLLARNFLAEQKVLVKTQIKQLTTEVLETYRDICRIGGFYLKHNNRLLAQ